MLQARITTKYNIPNLESEKYANKKRKRDTAEEAKAAEDEAPRVPRATLEVKAYDPESGVTLKFKTEKSADVGRLIAGLGRIGRQMAALPEKAEGTQALLMLDYTVLYNAANSEAALEDVAMGEAPTADGGAEAKDAPAPETNPAAAPPTTGASGGGKKKKKGKK